MRIIFSFLFFILAQSLAAQGLYIRAGYNGCFTKSTGTDKFISRYNEHRPELVKPLKSYPYMDGFTMQLGGVYKFIMVGIGYTGRSARNTAEGKNDSLQTLQFRANTFDVRVGAGIPLGERAVVMFGAEFGFGNLIVRSCEQNPSDSDGNWDKIYKHNIGTISPFVNIQLPAPFGISIEPYYLITIGPANLNELNNKLNPNQTDGRINAYFSGFGFKVLVGFAKFEGD